MVLVGAVAVATVVAVNVLVDLDIDEVGLTPAEEEAADAAELAEDVMEAELPEEAEDADEEAPGVLKEEIIPVGPTGYKHTKSVFVP